MGADFEPIRMLDNFYQTSAFYPMPVVLITTVSESGLTNIGPYSLCFPYIIADQGKHAMMLVSREDSNTAMNIKRTKVCAINFIEDDKKFIENAVLLGYPGDTTEEKMKDSIFTLKPSMRENKEPNVQYPEIIEEAFQVMECTWDDSFDRCLCEGGDNFVLKIDMACELEGADLAVGSEIEGLALTAGNPGTLKGSGLLRRCLLPKDECRDDNDEHRCQKQQQKFDTNSAHISPPLHYAMKAHWGYLYRIGPDAIKNAEVVFLNCKVRDVF